MFLVHLMAMGLQSVHMPSLLSDLEGHPVQGSDIGLALNPPGLQQIGVVVCGLCVLRFLHHTVCKAI